MMKKVIFMVLFCVICLGIIFFITIKTYYFQSYIKKFFQNKEIYIELIRSGWLNDKEYNYKKSVSIREQIETILEWKTSKVTFDRGGEYPYLTFKLVSLNGDVLFINLIIHKSNQAIKVIFFQNGKQIEYIKQIELYDIFEDIFKEIKNGTSIRNMTKQPCKRIA
jgi:hypothetical protein